MKLIEKTSELVFLQNYSIIFTWEFHAKIDRVLAASLR